MKQVCKHCKSTEVARCKWVNPNTNEIYHDVDSGTTLEWCMNCKSETEITIIEDDSYLLNRISQIKAFEKMSSKEQYEFMLKHKNDIVVFLDNDSTYFTFKEDIVYLEDNKDIFEKLVFSLDDYLGDSDGITELLDALKIHWEYV